MDAPRHLLLITTDQQRWDTLQCAGNQRIWTPHLNWLCDNGVRFTRAYSDSPVCLPARVTVMNGRHAAHHGVLSNRWRDGAIDPAASLPGVLRAAGWQTRAFGKMHFGPPRLRFGFEHVESDDDYDRFFARYPELARPERTGAGHNEHIPAPDPTPLPFTRAGYWVDRAIDAFETRDPSRPSFTWLSFRDPHPPLIPHPTCWDLYRDRAVPAAVRGDWASGPDGAAAPWQSVTWELSMTQRLGEAQLADVRRAYYALTTQVDYQLGRLFGALKALNLLERTLIIFTADHGEMLGDHGLGGKCVPFEGAAHIPLIIRPPAAARDASSPLRGTTCSGLACLADLLPTCLAWAGVPAPGGGDGLDLLALAQGGRGRERLFIDCMHLHGVIDDRFKFCRETLAGNELLFDLADDPLECRDLLAGGGAGEVADRLRGVLLAHLAATGQERPSGFDPATPTDARRLPRNVHPGFFY